MFYSNFLFWLFEGIVLIFLILACFGIYGKGELSNVIASIFSILAVVFVVVNTFLNGWASLLVSIPVYLIGLRIIAPNLAVRILSSVSDVVPRNRKIADSIIQRKIQIEREYERLLRNPSQIGLNNMKNKQLQEQWILRTKRMILRNNEITNNMEKHGISSAYLDKMLEGICYNYGFIPSKYILKLFKETNYIENVASFIELNSIDNIVTSNEFNWNLRKLLYKLK